MDREVRLSWGNAFRYALAWALTVVNMRQAKQFGLREGASRRIDKVIE